MLGDMRVLDLGDELLLDTERVALQELFNMIRRYKLGSDVELHKRTLELGAAVADRAGGRARSASRREHDNRRAEIAGQPVVLVRTDVGVDVFVPAESKAAVRRRARPCPRSTRRRPRSCASSAAGRATASTSTTA